MSLTPKQRRFVNEYCVDENAPQAAIRAGYSPDTAGVIGCENLKKPYIKEAIAERMEECAIAASITPEWVVGQWAKIATADPNAIVQVRRTCCRHCHGFGHQYQWTEAEYSAAVDRAVDSGKPAPDGMGGFGFNPNAAPAADCPECGGLGIEDVHVADTRKLRGPAKVLYAGAERTRNGIKIHMRDKDAAVANLARYLGMLVDKKEFSGPGGGPIPLANLTADDLTDDQLAAILKASDATDEA
jgi:phage terminase small subunit